MAVTVALAAALPVLVLLLACTGPTLGRGRVRRSFLWALLLFGVAGALRTSSSQREPPSGCTSPEAEGPSTLSGRLLGGVDAGRAAIRVEGAPCDDEVVRLIWQADVVPPGRVVRVSGYWRVRSTGGPANFVVRSVTHLGERDGHPLLHLRGRVLERSALVFGSSAGVIDALLLARREGLSYEVSNAFARSGVAHLLAISGFHVGVVATVFFVLTLWLPIRGAHRPLYTAGAVLAYLALIGFPTAATRAGLFLLALALARWRGRPVLSQGVMSTALMLILWFQPELLFSVGLQLSFAGVLGLAVSREPFEEALRGKGIPDGLIRPLAAALAASLWTAPLVGWHFGTVSWGGVVLSVVLTPWVALIIVGGLGALALSSVSVSLASLLGAPTAWATYTLVNTVDAIAAVPWIAFDVTRPILAATTVGAFVGMRLSRGALPGVRVVSVGTAMAVAPGLLSSVGGLTARPIVELVTLDVGQGDAIAIRTPHGRWIMVDAGGRTDRWDAGRDRIVPYLERRGVHALDLLLLSHADLDHTGGAEALLRAFPTRLVVDPGVAVPTPAYAALLTAAKERGVPWATARTGQEFEVDGVVLSVLAPDSLDATANVNDQSLVFVLRYGDFEALFTGDASSEVENRLRIPDEWAVEVLKVGHHGSRTSSGQALLTRLRPRLAVIPVGGGNRYGHPDPDVVSRLQASGAHILRTDLNGDVRIRADDSGRWEVDLERGTAPIWTAAVR